LEESYHFFGGKIPVSDLPTNKGSYNGSKRQQAVDDTYLDSGETQVVSQVLRKYRIPGSPDGILEKHHDTKTYFYTHVSPSPFDSL